MNRSASREVVEHVGKGLALVAALPDERARDRQELDLQFALGVAYRDLKGFNAAETQQAFRRAQALCERSGGEPTELVAILRGVYNYYFVGGDHRGGRTIAEQILTVAQQTQDTNHILQGLVSIGSNSFYRGELLESRSSYEHALSLYDTTQHYRPTTYVLNPRTAALMNVSWLLWTLGYPDQAIQTGNEAIAFSRALSQPFTLTVALTWVGSMRTCCGQIGAIETLIQELSDVVSKHQIAHWGERAIFLQGKLLLSKGPNGSGLALINRALDASRAAETRLAWTWMAAETVTEYLRVGDIEERNWEAELCRLKGALLLAQSAPDGREAEACFHHALDIARHQHAKSLELRAAMSLARLWQG